MASPIAITTAQLLAQAGREFIMIAGKDTSGKSSALVSIAQFVQQVLNPKATFNVIDTENKFPTALRSFGPDAPTNIAYYKCETMNDATNAMDAIMAARKAGDWVAVDSMSRVWERAQDMGYMAISGYSKAAYLEIRREKVKAAPVIPSPDNFWNIVKGAHDGAFADLMAQASTLNVVWTTTIQKVREDGGKIKENATRKEARLEFGMDVGIDGAPRLPYYVETLVLATGRDDKGINYRVVRDNPSGKDAPQVDLRVEGKKMFAPIFWTSCR